MSGFHTGWSILEDRKKVALPLLWIGMGSIIMFFAALTSAYLVRKGGDDWISLNLPVEFTWSTLFIIASSLLLLFASKAIKSDKHSQSTLFLSIALFLGVGFFIFQIKGFDSLIHNGIYLTGKESSISGSFLYVLVWAHLAHVTIGLTALAWILIKTVRKKYSKDDYIGFKSGVVFWHFLCLLWIYLFIFLYFV